MVAVNDCGDWRDDDLCMGGMMPSSLKNRGSFPELYQSEAKRGFAEREPWGSTKVFFILAKARMPRGKMAGLPERIRTNRLLMAELQEALCQSIPCRVFPPPILKTP